MTNTLCDVVEAVTGTVDTLTGGATDPVTDGVDKVTDEVLGRVGEAAPTTRATPPRPPRQTVHHLARHAEAQQDGAGAGDARRGVPAGARVRGPGHHRPAVRPIHALGHADGGPYGAGLGERRLGRPVRAPHHSPRAGRRPSARARRSRRRRPPTRRSPGSTCCGRTRSCTSSRCPCRTSGWYGPPRPPPTCWGRR
ncbi:hypothetical protein ACFQ0B_36035 [Nonomuraea thailandensis]